MDLSLVINIIIAISVLLAVAVLFFRGGTVKAGKDGIVLDIASPDRKILRDTSGGTYMEASLISTASRRLADLSVEVKGQEVSSLARAMDYTQTKLDSFLFDLDEKIASHIIKNQPSNGEDVILLLSPVTKNLRRQIIDDLFKPSFQNNGFYEFKAVSANGDVSVKRDWDDYMVEREGTIRGYIRHYLRNKFPHKVHLDPALEDMETGKLRTRLQDIISDIYDRFWAIYHQRKQVISTLLAEQESIMERIRKGEYPL